MFTLVVFTLVTGTTISGSFINAFDDVEHFGGGFDVRASTAPSRPSTTCGRDPPAAGARRRRLPGRGGQSFVPLDARQDGHRPARRTYPLRGLDDAFLDATTYRARGNGERVPSRRGGLAGAGERPGWRWSTPLVVPRRDNLKLRRRCRRTSSSRLLPRGRRLRPGPGGRARPADRPAPAPHGHRRPQRHRPARDGRHLDVAADADAAFGDRARPTIHHLATRARRRCRTPRRARARGGVPRRTASRRSRCRSSSTTPWPPR